MKSRGAVCPEKIPHTGLKPTKFRRTVPVIQHDTDRYGRMPEIILRDGRVLNRELVRAGHAWWYQQYNRNDAEMEVLEAHAREARMGLWHKPNPLPQWET